MRYEKGHKAATRQHILDVASKQFRKGGIEGVGLASLMKEAGLTNGAFYAHFESKEDLVREILVVAFDSQLKVLSDAVKQGLTLEDAICDYLSTEKRDNLEEGCPAAALMSEISRHMKSTRKVFSEKIHCLLELVSNQINDKNPIRRKQKAMAIYSLLVGSLQLARVEVDGKNSDFILSSGISAALEIAGLRSK